MPKIMVDVRMSDPTHKKADLNIVIAFVINSEKEREGIKSCVKCLKTVLMEYKSFQLINISIGNGIDWGKK